MYIYTCTCTHVHTCTYTYTPTSAYAYTCSYANACGSTCGCTYTWVGAASTLLVGAACGAACRAVPKCGGTRGCHAAAKPLPIRRPGSGGLWVLTHNRTETNGSERRRIAVSCATCTAHAVQDLTSRRASASPGVLPPPEALDPPPQRRTAEQVAGRGRIPTGPKAPTVSHKAGGAAAARELKPPAQRPPKMGVSTRIRKHQGAITETTTARHNRSRGPLARRGSRRGRA